MCHLSILSTLWPHAGTASMTHTHRLLVVRDRLHGGTDGMLAYYISFCPVHQILVVSNVQKHLLIVVFLQCLGLPQ